MLAQTTIGSTLLTGNAFITYDPMGRVQAYYECDPYNCGTSDWGTTYNYDLAGDVTSWTHPAGFTLTQTINTAREVTQVTSSWSDSTHPATLATVTYSPFGSVSTLQNGCVGSGCKTLQETYVYNKRLQMAVAELGTSSNHALDSCRVYNYYVGAANVSACSETPSAWPTGSNDNGNVAGYYYNDSVNSGLSHKASYGYDGVNRLTSAAATGNSTYSQTYSYTADGSAGLYGNLSCAPSGPGCVALTYNSSNRITTSGYTYDAAGNLTGDGTYTYQWDAEARLTVAYLSGTAVQTNTYNSLGQRVRDVTQTNTTEEVYGADGELLWRYTGSSTDPNQRAFVPFGGGILAEYYGGSPAGTIFDHPEELGSMSTSSDYTGNTFNEKLFYPFGELWTGAAIPNFNTHQTFAQLPDYDPETDQYSTLNRHYSPSGRWLSPDPGGVKIVKLDDPQTWNMYAYVRNNPTTLTDPTGLVNCEPNDPDCAQQFAEKASAEKEFAGDNTAQNQYDPKKTGPEDPTNPGKPLSQNPVVKKGMDEAFMKTTNGTARGGLAEAGGTIELKDGKISIANKVDSVNGDGKPNALAIKPDDNTIAIFHTHGNSADPRPSPGDRNPDTQFPDFVRSQSSLYVTVPNSATGNPPLNAYIQLQ